MSDVSSRSDSAFALVLPGVGEPLQWQPAKRREPGRGEVRVRMQAAAINPSDRMFVAGTYGVKPSPPCVPGFEGVGVVEACGSGLLPRAMKDRRVAVAAPKGGTWQTHVVTKADRIVPIGDDIPDEIAASFFVNPATAYVMTRRVLGLSSGDTLVQTAAASSLGRMIVRLNARDDIQTVCIVRHESQRDALLADGAAAVIVFDAAEDAPERLADQLRDAEATTGPIRHAIDPVGGRLTTALLAGLQDDAHVLVYGSLADEPFEIAPRSLLFHRQRVEGFALGAWLDEQSLVSKGRLFWTLRKLVADGTLAADRTKAFAPDDAAAALDPASTASGEKGVFRFSAEEPD